MAGTVPTSQYYRERGSSHGTQELRITPLSPSFDRVRVFDFSTVSHM